MNKYTERLHEDFQFHGAALIHLVKHYKPTEYKTEIVMRYPYENTHVEYDTVEYIYCIKLQGKLILFYCDDYLLAIHENNHLFVQEQEDEAYTGYLTSKLIEWLTDQSLQFERVINGNTQVFNQYEYTLRDISIVKELRTSLED